MQHITNSNDFATLIRQRRQELKLSQSQLATRAGVSRQWVIDVEKGKPRAEIELVLTLLQVLGIQLQATVAKISTTPIINNSDGEEKIRELASSFNFLK